MSVFHPSGWGLIFFRIGVEEERNFSKPSDITLHRGYLLRETSFFRIVRQNSMVTSSGKSSSARASSATLRQ